MKRQIRERIHAARSRSLVAANEGSQYPVTRGEWQTALTAAKCFRMIADLELYGLLHGGPLIDVARCDEFIEAGRSRGYTVADPTPKEVADFVYWGNAAGWR